MSSDEQNKQLKQEIQNRIDSDGISRVSLTMADQAISALRDNRNRDLDSIGYAILKLMMIDYLKTHFSK